MKVFDAQIVSKRKTLIPVTVVESKEKKKLLLLAHGFKAKRSEDGRFLTVAKALAEKGVSSIMMGFPGCDESQEDFLEYSLHSCLDDIDASYAYMKQHYAFESGDVGMIGYSMGARLTAMYMQKHPEITCIGLWAGALYDGFGKENAFLGLSRDILLKEVKEKGYCDFHNDFDNTDIRLSRDLILESDACRPSVSLSGYEGSALLVHGNEDLTVPCQTSIDAYELLKKAKKRKLCVVKGADHGFGAWNGRNDLSRQLTDATISFFEECFL